MKIYTEAEEPKKSWSIKLRISKGIGPFLSAVDSSTGRIIANLIEFRNSGIVIIKKDIPHYLETEGYDPAEHKNLFNSSGTLKIQYETIGNIHENL